MVARRLKLVASVIVRNEASRYLDPCVAHLLEFADEVCVLDDGSTDGWYETLRGRWRQDRPVIVTAGATRDDGSVAFNHHAAARNQLLRATLAREPDWILAIDADELVTDGHALRLACESGGHAYSLVMEECWELCDEALCVREDGGWRSHPVGMLWAPSSRGSYEIADLGHATGRVPSGVGGGAIVSEVLHLGWANRAERAERYQRYAVGDAGKFHAASHIASIMWEDSRVACRSREWPASLEPWRDGLVARANR